MNKSNIKFVSNVYVIADESKLSDKKFMSQVVDPEAIRAIAKLLPKDANGRVRFSSKLHGEIFNDSKPCYNGNGDYTHGVIRENGELVFVNTCENEACSEFRKCQAASNYRKIERDEQITVDNVGEEIRTDDEFCFDIELPATPKTVKAQKLRLRKTHKREIIEEITNGVRVNDYKRWEVRGFWRHLSDGSVTWVRPHNRHHDEEEIEVKYYVKKFKHLKYRFKNVEQLDRFIKIVADAERRAKERYKYETEISQASNTYQLKNIKRIDSAKIIIESPLTSRILVNAGPGTGKTHTVIERLKHIDVNEEDIIPDSVLVLCFSRSAVKVIRDRLAKAIDNGEISPYAKLFTVMTFDSFATWYLMQNEPKRNLTYNSYDERIKMFIQEYEQDIKKLNESLSYLIVDEVQDLVGVRTELVQVLLNHIDCGFLLLGDECQAIYDYQISDEKEMNASRLYEWLEKSFDTLEEYELTKDWRHTTVLGKAFAPLRSAMLYRPFNIQREELTKILKKYDVSDLSTEDIIKCRNTDGKKAILSWSNGDAYRQSQDLYLSHGDIKHTILTGSRKISFRRELALIFSNYLYREIDKTTFLKLAAGVGMDKGAAKLLWEGMLFAVDKESDDSIVLEALRRALISERRIDENLISEDDAEIVISTIHKAKGKEYDSVYLNQNGEIRKSDDIKVYYVALTRAKNELAVKRHYSYRKDYKTDQDRYVEISSGKLKKIELGIDGDIDPIGFVSTQVPGMDPVTRQKYILESVKIGDALKVSKFKGNYLISHNGHFIGSLNKDALNDYYKQTYPSGKSFTHRFNGYTDFVDLYVKDVVAIVNNTINSDIGEPYNKSGFWLGIEFCGYAKPMEE